MSAGPGQDLTPQIEVPVLKLHQLGWKPFFNEQLSVEERDECMPVRVLSVHRGMVTIAGERLAETISSTVPMPSGPEDRPTVGDWLLMDPRYRTIRRILDRASLFKRPAPGNERRLQLIAANVDTLFVVSSCDQDFNVARIERYLVLASEAGVRPVLVLTKTDLLPDHQRFLEDARTLQVGLQVEPVNARDPASLVRLAAHCGVGETVALVGSSGVGKSTLINKMKGSDTITTQAPRESDGKGLHTTVVRQMHHISKGPQGGGWLIDTPGMRELQMSEVTSGVAEVFDDVAAITLECRFTNCTHKDEPGCAVRAAVAIGSLEPARLARWQKLADEDAGHISRSAGRPALSGKAGRRK